MFEVSVVIPYHHLDDRRQKLLDYVLERWRQLFPAFELVVSDDDSGGLVFNKPRALNNGVRQATGELLILADADVVFERRTIERAVEMVKTGEAKWMVPFELCERLDEPSSDAILALPPDVETFPREFTVLTRPSHGPGAINVLPRIAWKAVGGYDESFEGWGYEDTMFQYALNYIWGAASRLSDTIYHLSHARTLVAGRECWMFQANLKRLERRKALLLAGKRLEALGLGRQANLPQPIDCLIPSGKHYIDHIAPIWQALPVQYRGKFYVGPGLVDYARAKGIDAVVVAKSAIQDTLSSGSQGLVLLAGHSDSAYTDAAGRYSVIAMHGVGFLLGTNDASARHYPGAKSNRAKVALMLSSNESIAEKERRANPHIPAVVIGCPKLDTWIGRERPGIEPGAKPTLGLCWHWRPKHNSIPEAQTAFDYYKQAIPALAERYRLLGSGHPNMMAELRPYYEQHGIEIVESFDEIVERADLLICDASSVQYEWAVLDRPQVVLNCPEYRRDVNFGLRFWEHADVGVQCDGPAGLEKAIEEALADEPEQKERRRAAAAAAYGVTDGTSSQRAAKAIIRCAELCDPLCRRLIVESDTKEKAASRKRPYGARPVRLIPKVRTLRVG